ncbi:kinase-regulated stress-responsive transcription factor skn7 [Lobosporangium transversale]|nr:kinase-regulated stress-responsive transcription factor skn7 [Lobosporangium transversale]
MVIPSWAMPPKVLLVEDDDTCRRLSSRLLQIFGCPFDVAEDGMAAVGKMSHQKYDIVLMDIVMPKLDGVSATTQIRRFDAMTPIISMTSNITTNDILTYFANGMNDILPKPFSKVGLLNMLEKHCQHLRYIKLSPSGLISATTVNGASASCGQDTNRLQILYRGISGVGPDMSNESGIVNVNVNGDRQNGGSIMELPLAGFQNGSSPSHKALQLVNTEKRRLNSTGNGLGNGSGISNGDQDESQRDGMNAALDLGLQLGIGGMLIVSGMDSATADGSMLSSNIQQQQHSQQQQHHIQMINPHHHSSLSSTTSGSRPHTSIPLSLPGSVAAPSSGLMSPIGSRTPFSSSMMTYPIVSASVSPISQQHPSHLSHPPSFQHSMHPPSHQPYQQQGPTMTLLSIRPEGPIMMTAGGAIGDHGGIDLSNSTELGDTMGLRFAAFGGMGADLTGTEGLRGRKRAKIEAIE